MVASYIAFKALVRNREGYLESPMRRAVWYPADTPWGKLPACRARDGDLDLGHGIFAASYEEAAKYGPEIYAVIPLGDTVLGADGWRTSMAAVLCRVETPRDAAMLVIDAYIKGYPQIDGVMAWAAMAAAEHDAFHLLDDILEITRSLGKEHRNAAEALYIIGRDWPEELATPAVAEALASIGDAYLLVEAGRDWKDGWFHPIIAEALARTRNATAIVRAGEGWQPSRFHQSLIKAMAQAAEDDLIYKALMTWPEEILDPALVRALCKSKNSVLLYNAGCFLPDSIYSPEILAALLDVGEPADLYWAGLRWPDSRFSPAIIDALIKTGSAEHLFCAGRNWPDARYDPRIADALIQLALDSPEKNAYWIHRAGLEWADNRFDYRFAQVLIQVGREEWLSSWPVERVL